MGQVADLHDQPLPQPLRRMPLNRANRNGWRRLRLWRLQPLLLTSLVALAGCHPRNDAEGRGRVELSAGVPVGAVLSLSGNANAYGQDQKLGLTLAQEAINAAGGIAGSPVQLQLEDGGSDEAGASAAMSLQIQRGVLAVIGPTLSQQAFAADPIAQRHGVPVVAPSNTAKGIPQIGWFISRVSAQSSRIAPLSIAMALQLQPGLRRPAVFYSQDDAYSTAETTIFQQALVAKGLKPITVQRTNVTDTDFQNQITDTLQLQPDLIVISALPMDGGNLVRQIRELGYKGSLVVGNGMNSPNIYPICQRYCDGMLIAQAYSPEAASPINRRFLELYRQLRGGAVPPQFSAQAFTAYQVVVEALQKLQAAQPPGKPLTTLPLAELRRRLNQTLLAGTYQTPLGEIRFTGDGEVIQKQFYVAQVKMNPAGSSGRFVLLPSP